MLFLKDQTPVYKSRWGNNQFVECYRADQRILELFRNFRVVRGSSKRSRAYKGKPVKKFFSHYIWVKGRVFLSPEVMVGGELKAIMFYNAFSRPATIKIISLHHPEIKHFTIHPKHLLIFYHRKIPKNK